MFFFFFYENVIILRRHVRGRALMMKIKYVRKINYFIVAACFRFHPVFFALIFLANVQKQKKN